MKSSQWSYSTHSLFHTLCLLLFDKPPYQVSAWNNNGLLLMTFCRWSGAFSSPCGFLFSGIARACLNHWGWCPVRCSRKTGPTLMVLWSLCWHPLANVPLVSAGINVERDFVSVWKAGSLEAINTGTLYLSLPSGPKVFSPSHLQNTLTTPRLLKCCTVNSFNLDTKSRFSPCRWGAGMVEVIVCSSSCGSSGLGTYTGVNKITPCLLTASLVIFPFSFLIVLGIQPRALCIQSKNSTTDPHPRPFWLLVYNIPFQQPRGFSLFTLIIFLLMQWRGVLSSCYWIFLSCCILRNCSLFIIIVLYFYNFLSLLYFTAMFRYLPYYFHNFSNLMV